MKKLYYLLSFIGIAAAFTACNPLDKTYQAIGPVTIPTAPGQAITYTLTAADYGLLPKSSSAYKTLSFVSKDTAAAQIPTVLTSKFGNYPDKSTAVVTYSVTPASIKLADSLQKDVAYTLVNPADYLLLKGNTFADFSASQILSWLPVKYPNPVNNQLALLTFIYYESGVTSTVTQSFLYTNGAWQKIYTVSPAQYASIGKGGTSNDFSTSDVATIPAYLGAFLKNDPAVTATAKVGDVQYVSYTYYIPKSGTVAAITYQRVLPLVYNGTTWVNTPQTTTLSFAKTNGKWVADNTVNYTLVSADYTYIAGLTTTGASADALANLKNYGNFNQQGSTTSWTNDQIFSGLVSLLQSKYGTTAVANQKFVLTYTIYTGAYSSPTKTYIYDGAKFVAQ